MVSSYIRQYDQKVLVILLGLSTVLYSLTGFVIYDGYHLKLSVVATNFLYSLIFVFLARELILRFHDRLSPSISFQQRVIIQCLGLLVVYGLIQTFILFVAEPYFNQRPVSTNGIWCSYVIGFTLILIASVAYTSLFFGAVQNQANNSEKNEKGQRMISGKKNGVKMVRPIDQFVSFYTESGVTFGVDTEGDRMILFDNLAEIESFGQKHIFRANRQHIVSYESVESYTHLANKTVAVYLKNRKEAIIVSRYKAPAFKKWIADRH